MIQEFLRAGLMPSLPNSGMMWTTDFKPRDDNTITIYFEGGGEPGQYDVPTRYPRYMVYISSSNWDYAEYAASVIFEELPKLKNQVVEVNFYGRSSELLKTESYKIQSITPAGDIMPLGVEENIKDYSINFDVVLIELKEENLDGT